MQKLRLLGVAMTTAFFVAAPVSLNWSSTVEPTLSVDSAQARVGRPLTPGSVAGVHRRVERRTYRRGVYYGAGAAAAYGAYYYGRQCGYYPYPPCY